MKKKLKRFFFKFQAQSLEKENTTLLDKDQKTNEQIKDINAALQER